MLTARWSLAVGVVNGILYAVGGKDIDGNILTTVEAYDPMTDTWSAKAPMPSPREIHSVAVLENQLYAVGGNYGGFLSTMVAYDPATNNWSNSAFMPVEVFDPNNCAVLHSVSGARGELATDSINGILYAVGGDQVRMQCSPSTEVRVAVPTLQAFADYLVWGTNNAGVGTITQYGQATGRNVGTATLTARTGTIAGEATLTVTPQPIQVNVPDTASTQVGSTTSWACASFVDPAGAAGAPWSATVNYGDGPPVQQIAGITGGSCGGPGGSGGPTGAFSLSHAYTQTGTFAVTVTVANNAGASGTAYNLHVTVNSGGGGGGGAQIFLGVPNSVSTQVNNAQWGCGSFFDQNSAGGSWSVMVNYNTADPSSQPETLSFTAPQSGGPCTGGNTPPTGVFFFNHAYSSPGSFQVSVKVTNTVTGTSGTGGFTVDVTASSGNGDHNGCAEVTLTLSAGNNVPSTLLVQMTVIDRTTGQAVFATTVPIGNTDFGKAPAGSYRFQFTAPTGYTVTPAQINVDVTCGHDVTLSARVDVVDTPPPVLTVPANITAEATGQNGAVVTFAAPTATDSGSGVKSVTADHASGETFPLGTTTVHVTATDNVGNTATKSFTVTVVDTTPPAITSVTPSRGALWPPDHKMVPVSIAVTDSDAVDPAPACSIRTVTSNEPINGLGDGDMAPDWQFSPNNLLVNLRSERSGKGTGRVYTIAVACTDKSGNTSMTKTTVVTVPHDQGK